MHRHIVGKIHCCLEFKWDRVERGAMWACGWEGKVYFKYEAYIYDICMSVSIATDRYAQSDLNIYLSLQFDFKFFKHYC